MAVAAALAASGFVQRWVLLAVGIGLWQLWAVSARSVYFPPPREILTTLGEQWSGGGSGPVAQESWARDLLVTLTRLGTGWGIAVVLGVVIGVVLGRSGKLEAYVDPPLQFLRAIPPPAVIPLFLVVLGTGFRMRVALVVFGALWPVLLNTVEGVRAVSTTQLAVASAFRIPRGARIRRVVLPAASPKIVAGMRVSLSISLILVALSEMIASDSGLGYQLIRAQQMFAMPRMWAAIITIGLLGVVLNSLFLAFERRALAWHQGARGRGN
ncbi:ABC transporter permease [Streptomyces sp. NPDC048278]|uniref:ABC transporter permease n=1 Tax=Streptomyces sp. NPDC048278 TaxID=3155809 RepID=UPI003442A1A7